MIHVMLSLDLQHVTKMQRSALDKSLKEDSFVKLTGVDTVWAYALPDAPQDHLIARAALVMHNFLQSVAKRIEIEKITYVLQIANSTPVGTIIENVSGTYKTTKYDPAQPFD